MSYIGYTRVSTVKQGTKGVSLIEQKDAILQYASIHNLPISTWLTETETAAKAGRPKFDEALKMLRLKKAKGIIVHKLDRGARNLRDWNEIGELADKGVEIHFVHESLDLKSRGGRLSADLQAVVAADFIRNVKEETRKGFYGRLKQGLYPLPAPIGYLDHGRAKPKSIDPIRGPLIRKAYELYASGHYGLKALGKELHRLGLRNRRGGIVSLNGLSRLLKNPFYIGIIHLCTTGERFSGVHKSLIRKALFDRVQDVLHGKVNERTRRHTFLFRRMLTCHSCGYSLIGERQKGKIYYRCHTKACPTTSVREDSIEATISKYMEGFQFGPHEKAHFMIFLEANRRAWITRRNEEVTSLNLRLIQIKDRLNRLTDAYLDGILDKKMFEERKTALLLDLKGIEDQLDSIEQTNGTSPDKVGKFLELAEKAGLSYQLGNPEERREILRIFTSNRIVDTKILYLKPSIAFETLQNRPRISNCDPSRDGPRTLDPILNDLTKLSLTGQLPDLSGVVSCSQDDRACS